MEGPLDTKGITQKIKHETWQGSSAMGVSVDASR
jgi:hypothetical protein